MRIAFASIAFTLAACAANPSRALVSEQDVLALARSRTAEECMRHEHGCDIEASKTAEGWWVSVTPVLGIASDGQHLYAIHSGWNLIYSPTGKFKGDRGW